MTATPLPILELPDELRPIRRTEFQALVDMGVFDGTHVELVGGVLVEMSPQGEDHSEDIRVLTKLLVRAVGDDYAVGVQTPLAVDDISLPEPDLQVLPVGDYRRGHPERALLVVEVSNSSIRFDLGEKARRYAMAGYPEYWVVDVGLRVVHVHTDPEGEGWGSIVQVGQGTLVSSSVPVVRVDLALLFPDG